jgi:hypothetical protein
VDRAAGSGEEGRARHRLSVHRRPHARECGAGPVNSDHHHKEEAVTSSTHYQQAHLNDVAVTVVDAREDLYGGKGRRVALDTEIFPDYHTAHVVTLSLNGTPQVPLTMTVAEALVAEHQRTWGATGTQEEIADRVYREVTVRDLATLDVTPPVLEAYRMVVTDKSRG